MEEERTITELLFAEDVQFTDAIPLRPVGPAVSTTLVLQIVRTY